MDGVSEASTVTLRVPAADGGFLYASAPQSRMAFTVSGLETLSLLLYADSPARYLLKNLRVTPCPGA